MDKNFDIDFETLSSGSGMFIDNDDDETQSDFEGIDDELTRERENETPVTANFSGTGNMNTDFSKLKDLKELNELGKKLASESEKRGILVQNPEYIAEKPMSDEAKEKHTKVIDEVEMVVQQALDEVNKSTSPRERVREYSNNAEMEKTKYATPYTEGSPLPKILIFIGVCIGLGVALGLQSCSYYNFAMLTGKKIEGNFSCVFSWLLEENMPFNPMPINSSVFMTGFITGFLALAVIGLFIYLDSDSKKQSRVGHEHGNARLGTPKDFKNFKNRFMER